MKIDFKAMKLIECKISIRLQDFQLKTSLKGGCNRVKIAYVNVSRFLLPVINSCLQLGFKDGRQVIVPGIYRVHWLRVTG